MEEGENKYVNHILKRVLPECIMYITSIYMSMHTPYQCDTWRTCVYGVCILVNTYTSTQTCMHAELRQACRYSMRMWIEIQAAGQWRKLKTGQRSGERLFLASLSAFSRWDLVSAKQLGWKVEAKSWKTMKRNCTRFTHEENNRGWYSWKAIVRRTQVSGGNSKRQKL